MRGFNKVFLMGYLGQPPELLVSKNGANYTKLSLAVHKALRSDDGTWETKTEWHRVMVWGKTAELCADHLHKGSALAVEGHLSQRKTKTTEGQEDIRTTIVASEVHFLPNPRQQTLPMGALETQL